MVKNIGLFWESGHKLLLYARQGRSSLIITKYLVWFASIPFPEVMREAVTSHTHGPGNSFMPALAPGIGELGLYTHGSRGVHQAVDILDIHD